MDPGSKIQKTLIPDPGSTGSRGQTVKKAWDIILVFILWLSGTDTDLVVEVPEAEDGLLLDLAEDGEEGRLHSVTVQRVLPSLNNPPCYKFFKKLFRKIFIQPLVFRIRIRKIRMLLGHPEPDPSLFFDRTEKIPYKNFYK